MGSEQLFFETFHDRLDTLGVPDFAALDADSPSPWGAPQTYGLSLEGLTPEEVTAEACRLAEKHSRDIHGAYLGDRIAYLMEALIEELVSRDETPTDNADLLKMQADLTEAYAELERLKVGRNAKISL